MDELPQPGMRRVVAELRLTSLAAFFRARHVETAAGPDGVDRLPR